MVRGTNIISLYNVLIILMLSLPTRQMFVSYPYPQQIFLFFFHTQSHLYTVCLSKIKVKNLRTNLRESTIS